MQYGSALRKQDCDRLQPFGILQINVRNGESYSNLQTLAVRDPYIKFQLHIFD